MELQCSACKFWEEISDTPAMGSCRRHAPLAVILNPLSEFSNLDARWPRTKPEDWCGEWDRKIETKNL